MRRRQPRLARNEALEARTLLSVNIADSESLALLTASHAQTHSCGCAACSVPPPPADYRTENLNFFAPAQFPLTDTFKLNSLPGALKTIYLDFDGHLTQNTYWNTRYSVSNTPAFSLDADYAAFSDAEKTTIQDVWARVAEDFMPFAVNVTTEDPGIDGLLNTGGSDTAWGIRVVVGGDGKWKGSAGVAVLGGFGKSDGSPAFAFADQWWKTNPNIIAQCISHEVGHTLGLDHDGPDYYGGHGTGATSWVPIMGSGDKSLSQWSKGEYNGASNKQDDLAIITGTVTTTWTPNGNGFGYRPDDHGNTTTAASTVSGATAKGIIERNTDVDVFQFTSTGTVKATISPAAFGANLDILAEILDSSGNVLQTSNPIGALDASFNFSATAGTYYLRVQGTGQGDPLATGYTKYGSLGQYTVAFDNAPPPPPTGPTLSISDLSVTEGNSGITGGFVTIKLSQAATQTVTVQWAPKDGTATLADNDYKFPSTGGTATFAAGQTSVQIDVVVNGDTKSEPDETFDIVLSDAKNATISDGIGTITIVNDDAAPPPPATPTLSVGDVSVVEGNSGSTQAAVTIKLSAAATGAVTVGYSTVDDTATTADNDYSAASGTVTFAAGETQKTVVVTVKGDTKAEPNEQFAFKLSNAQGATIDRATATITITNDDSPTPPPPPASATISVNDVTVTEGNSGTTVAEFTVSLSAAATAPVTVSFRTADGTATTADRDYLATTGRLTFARGETTKKVRVFVYGDTKNEAAESFSLVLSSPTNATIAKDRGTGTISNDDTPPRISVSIADASIREGNSGQRILSFVVSLSTAAREAITLRVQTADGTATAGSDYVALASRNLVFGRGMMRQSVSVWVNGDRTFEQDETFTVSISEATGASIGRATATGRILNDDPASAPALVQLAAWAQFAQAEVSASAKTGSARGR